MGHLDQATFPRALEETVLGAPWICCLAALPYLRPCLVIHHRVVAMIVAERTESYVVCYSLQLGFSALLLGAFAIGIEIVQVFPGSLEAETVLKRTVAVM